MSKKVIIFTIISIGILIFGIAATIFGILNVSTVHVEKNFSAEKVAERDIYIYLPPGYDLSFGKSYPVIYILDGEIYFNETREEDKVKWSMKSTLDRLIRADEIEDVMVVGIGSSAERGSEYTNTHQNREEANVDVYSLHSFIIEELKPYIDRKYRTKPEVEYTLIGGKDLAGLAAIYMGSMGSYSMVGALSPALWQKQAEELESIAKQYAQLDHISIWLDEYSDQELVNEIQGEANFGWDEYSTLLEGFMDQMREENNSVQLRIEEVVLGESEELSLELRLESLLRYHFGQISNEQ